MLIERLFSNHNIYLISDQRELVKLCIAVFEKIINHQFLMGVIYVAKHDDPELFVKINTSYLNIKNSSLNAEFVSDSGKGFSEMLGEIAQIDIYKFDANSHGTKVYIESITYCLQPLLAVKVLQNPNSDTQVYVGDLLMIQRLKNYSMSRLYCEIIRACLMSLYVSGSTRESIWCAFTFIKVPHIIKQLSIMSEGN